MTRVCVSFSLAPLLFEFRIMHGAKGFLVRVRESSGVAADLSFVERIHMTGR